MNISHVSLVMTKDSDLMVYKNKGWPTKAETESIEVNGDLRKELGMLKRKMKYKDGTDILLAVSIASDEMIRAFHMFPEVAYLDVTSNTNAEGRDLFLMVGKDADGSTFIANATIIPSQQRWVFKKIYHFFPLIYGETCISRLRLALTDDDPAEHGPFDTCVKTQKCYEDAISMLCVFHGVVMKYQEQIYPKLPHKKGTKLLTKQGDLYGECI